MSRSSERSPRRRDTHLSPCSLKNPPVPLTLLRLGDRRPRWAGSRTTPLMKATIPVIVREGGVVKARSSRKEEGPARTGPARGRSHGDGLGAGLQQVPRHQSSTAGSSMAFQPLWAYVPWQPDSDKSLPQVIMMETLQELRQQDA